MRQQSPRRRIHGRRARRPFGCVCSTEFLVCVAPKPSRCVTSDRLPRFWDLVARSTPPTPRWRERSFRLHDVSTTEVESREMAMTGTNNLERSNTRSVKHLRPETACPQPVRENTLLSFDSRRLHGLMAFASIDRGSHDCTGPMNRSLRRKPPTVSPP